MIGLKNYIFEHPDKSDLFEFEQEHFSFPCVACRHRFRDAILCGNCVYFA